MNENIAASFKCTGINIRTILFLFSTLMCSVSSAQNHDCNIYEIVLNYFNEKEGEVKYAFEGPINPETGSLGQRIELTGIRKLSFHIIERKADFNYRYMDWFSDLLQDRKLKRYKYNSGTDSTVMCEFSNNVKYQYVKSILGKGFKENDFSFEINGSDTIHYNPMRIRFSKILYTKNLALVYVNMFEGMVGTRCNKTYGFLFKKEGENWLMNKAEI